MGGEREGGEREGEREMEMESEMERKKIKVEQGREKASFLSIWGTHIHSFHSTLIQSSLTYHCPKTQSPVAYTLTPLSLMNTHSTYILMYTCSLSLVCWMCLSIVMGMG